MSVRDTSMEAFEHLRETGKINDREKDVLEWIDEYNDKHDKNGTAREIHEWLAVDKGNEEAQLNGPNYIKPRITDLKDKGYIEEGEKRECSVSGRKAYEVKTVAKQETLDEDEDDYYVDEDGNNYLFNPNEDPAKNDDEEDGTEEKSEYRKEVEALAGVDQDEDTEDDDDAKQTLLMEDGEVVG